MFQIDFMISKRLDVRKVNWRGVKASGSISARIWEQVGSNHALLHPTTHLLHIIVYFALHISAITLYASISTWNLNISTFFDDIDMLHPSRQGGQCADISVDWCWPTTWLPSCNHLSTRGLQTYTLILCTSMLWCRRGGMFAYACMPSLFTPCKLPLLVTESCTSLTLRRSLWIFRFVPIFHSNSHLFLYHSLPHEGITKLSTTRQ